MTVVTFECHVTLAYNVSTAYYIFSLILNIYIHELYTYKIGIPVSLGTIYLLLTLKYVSQCNFKIIEICIMIGKQYQEWCVRLRE